jgi:hypothetical protein
LGWSVHLLGPQSASSRTFKPVRIVVLQPCLSQNWKLMKIIIMDSSYFHFLKDIQQLWRVFADCNTRKDGDDFFLVSPVPLGLHWSCCDTSISEDIMLNCQWLFSICGEVKTLHCSYWVVGGQVHNVISMEQGGFSVSMHMW